MWWKADSYEAKDFLIGAKEVICGNEHRTSFAVVYCFFFDFLSIYHVFGNDGMEFYKLHKCTSQEVRLPVILRLWQLDS